MTEPSCSIERDRTSVSNGDVALEAQLLWEGDVLAVVHAPMTRGRVLRVCDLGLPGADADLVVARNVRGRCQLVSRSGDAVEEGHRLDVPVGAALLRLSLVARATDARSLAYGDGELVRACSGAALFHAVLLVLAFLGRAALGDEEREAVVTMRGFVSAVGTGDRDDDDDAETGGGGGGGANPTESPAKEARAVRSAAHVPGVLPDARDEMESFGMISLIGQRLTAPSTFGDGRWSEAGALFGSGNAGFDLAGSGLSGAGLSGTGESGGGRGEGIGIGGIGTIGRGGAGCGGCGGAGSGRLGGSHVVHAPSICRNVVEEGTVPHCDGMEVTGRLPPEVVQRIVRQNFGRFRACYEDGLVRNPSLAGRIDVKFVIDGAGAVASAAARGFADESVSRCVARAYEAMSFPQPEGGIVTVVYPLVFSA